MRYVLAALILAMLSACTHAPVLVKKSSCQEAGEHLICTEYNIVR